MAPQSRGNQQKRLGAHSRSTPNLKASSSIRPLPRIPEPVKSGPRRRDLEASNQIEDSDFSTGTTDTSYTQDFALLLGPDSSDEDDSDDDRDEPSSAASASAIKPTHLSPPPPTTGTPTVANPRRPLYSQVSRSSSYLGPHTSFAPPFYNRPPTPLPPSPSLTSLLRPLSFTTSANASRPNTPDSSDTEAGTINTTATGATNATAPPTHSTAAAVAHSARTATTLPRASPKVPTYEYYGFVLYLGSSLAFVMYLLWSYLPTPFLHQLGIYYYPNRWWSLAVPAWLVVFIVYIYVALASFNTGYLTLPMSSLECFTDEKGQIAVVDAWGRIVREDRFASSKRGFRTAKAGKSSKTLANAEGTAPFKQPGLGGYGRIGLAPEDTKIMPRKKKRGSTEPVSQRQTSPSANAEQLPDLDWRTLWNEGTDAVLDVPIGGVCEILYGRSSEHDSDISDRRDHEILSYPSQLVVTK